MGKTTSYEPICREEKYRFLPDELKALDLSDWCGEVLSGNLCHRLKIRDESRMTGPNFIPTLLTHIRFDTTTAYNLVKGGIDRTIFFQEEMNFNQALTLMKYQSNQIILPSYAITFTCPGCIEILPSDYGDLSIDLSSMREGSAYPQIEGQDIYTGALVFSDAEEYIEDYLSYVVGYEIGLTYDMISKGVYADDTIDDVSLISRQTTKFSLTEFRYINFEYLIAGIIRSSHEFRIVLMENQELTLDKRSRCFMSLADILIQTHRLPEFLLFLECPAIYHG